MHPLDLVKTRMQSSDTSGARFTSMRSCLLATAKSEGLTRPCTKVVHRLLEIECIERKFQSNAETPKRATKFFTFDLYIRFFRSAFPDGASKLYTCGAAGFCAGLTEGVLIQPFEVIKVQLQLQRNVQLKQQESAFAVAKRVARTRGFGSAGISRGLTATLARHSIWNGTYFGFINCPLAARLVCVVSAQRVTGKQTVDKFIVGTVAGGIASTVNIPADVCKSRMQAAPPDRQLYNPKYRHLLQTMVHVYRNEGFLALYSGLAPKLLRLAPGGGILLVVYETAVKYLEQTLPHF